MKFGIGATLVIGLIVGGSLIVYGITSNEAGFWMWVGVVILGIVLLGYYAKKLRENPPSKRLSLVAPLFGLQDTIIGPDSVIQTGTGVEWLTLLVITAVVVVIGGGIWLIKRKDEKRALESRPVPPVDYPPPDDGRPDEGKEKRRHPRSES